VLEAVGKLPKLLPIRSRLHDQQGEANMLSYLATAYGPLGELEKADISELRVVQISLSNSLHRLPGCFFD
jgi:hypothetical protein